MPKAENEESVPPGAAARRLIRSAERATLATTLQRVGFEGWPYGSLVLVACAPDASPLLLLSDLADHSKNLMADARVALLFDGTAGLDDPLTGPRLSLLGHARETASPADRARYLARRPGAALYAGFKDFRFYRLEVEAGHLVAGFGRIHWLEAGQILYDSAAAERLGAQEDAILAHMNGDHAEAVALYARKLLGRAEPDWVMAGIDPEGVDLRAGTRLVRLEFPTPVCDPEEARAMLVKMAREARGRGAA